MTKEIWNAGAAHRLTPHTADVADTLLMASWHRGVPATADVHVSATTRSSGNEIVRNDVGHLHLGPPDDSPMTPPPNPSRRVEKGMARKGQRQQADIASPRPATIPGPHTRSTAGPVSRSYNASPTLMLPAALVSLQRLAGNRAVLRLVEKSQSPDVAHPKPGTPRAQHPIRRIVQRVLAVQIKPNPDGTKINSVEVVGRPEGYWTDTMGDHTTAFAVHVQGLRIRLQGKTIAEAAGIVNEMVGAAHELPGVSLVDNLKEEHKGQYKAALQKVKTATEPAAASALSLQSYINAYLCFRELIPASVIKTKLKSALFGKSKSERRSLKKLTTYEMNPKDASTDGLDDAIKGLFDAIGVGMMAAEPEKDVREMAPGMPRDKSPVDRAKLAWTQHLSSIKMSFPNAHAAVIDKLSDEDVIAHLKEELRKDIDNDVLRARDAIAKAQNVINGYIILGPDKMKKEGEYTRSQTFKVDYKKYSEEATEWLSRGNEQLEALKGLKYDSDEIGGRAKKLKELDMNLAALEPQIANALKP